MTKITAATRAAARQMLEGSMQYDASSMRITRDGSILARKDQDKTARYEGKTYYLVGHVADLAARA